MTSTGLVISDRYIEHDTGPHHPESSQRIRAINQRIAEIGLSQRTQLIEPQTVDLSLVQQVHTPMYIDELRDACQNRAPFIDTPECPLCPSTFEIACLSAGGAVQAVDAVMAGNVRNVFCVLRPPGHHAESSAAMGFCYFNNVAIAAQYIRTKHRIERVAILDWDVHHGNGTQHCFYRDPHVLYVSIHQDPRTLYPGTGFSWETGSDQGQDTTLNIPMPPGSGDRDYRRAFESEIIPKIGNFKPGFILISAGFDAHRDDPLAQINLSTKCFTWMTRQMVQLAGSLCSHRIVSMLEGGYNLRALADSVQAHVEAMETDNFGCPLQ
ncbi:MAG: histone deacetylase family protein [Planctomycetota bacterium]|jgi:acetoin utilization deacetylase AcuC-like enzyme